MQSSSYAKLYIYWEMNIYLQHALNLLWNLEFVRNNSPSKQTAHVAAHESLRVLYPQGTGLQRAAIAYDVMRTLMPTHRITHWTHTTTFYIYGLSH